MLSFPACAALLSFFPIAPLGPSAAVPWPVPALDEGYDLVVLETPHRVVMGGTLDLRVLGRPGNPYVVFGDVGRQLTVFGNLWIHLDMGPHLFLAAEGRTGADGRGALHRLKVPDLPFLDGSVLYFQAFAVEPGAFGGLAASDGKKVTFHKELRQPLITLLTVNGIPRDQNGSEIAEGRLTVPPTGFSIDLRFDDRGRGAIDPGSLVVTADRPLGGGAIRPGVNLARFFTVTATDATAVVSTAWAFPPNQTITLRATIKNRAGVVAPMETYTVNCRNWTRFNKPFRTRQLWLLDFDRHDLDNSGVKDYREDLLLFGLGSDAKAVSGPSANVDQWTRRTIQTLLRGYFKVGRPDGVNVDFVLKRPAGTHATICIGGLNRWPANQLPPGAKGTTGAAFLNPWNQRKNIVDCFGFVGVHPRSIHKLFSGVPQFQAVFGPLNKNPVGQDPVDGVVTAPGFDPTKGTARQKQRYAEIKAGVDAFSKAVAFILTQETCHSMGLVPNGRPGAGGLLGGLAFGHSTNGHFDDGRGNFMSGNNSTPAPATRPNLSLIWGHFQSGRGHFTPLNWAYLRERLINL